MEYDNNPSSSTYTSTPDRTSGAAWVLFAFVVFLGDFFYGFRGISLDRFIDIILSGNWRVFINGITAIGIGAYIFLTHGKKNPQEVFSFAGIVMFVSMLFSMGLNAGTDWIGAIFHLTFAFLFLWGELYNQMPRDKANIIILLALLLDFFIFSFFKINKLILPVWFILSIIYSRHFKGKNAIAFLIFLFYIFFFIGPIATQAGTLDLTTGKDVHEAIDYAKQSWNNFNNFIRGIGSSAGRQVERTQAMVFGDYYTSQVDQNVQSPLGISIVEVKSTDPDIYEDEPVTAYARIQARTLNDPITINTFCHADSLLPDAIEPNNGQYEVMQYDETDIDCMFSKCRFSPGSKTIYFNIDFTFTTMSYLRNYFMDRDRISSMISKDPEIRSAQDILGFYGITDINPIASSTNGPMSIGVKLADTQPVGLDRDVDAVSFRLGITLDNLWDGKVKNINDLFIILPKHVSLDPDSTGTGKYCGGYDFNAVRCSDVFDDADWCNDEEVNIYSIDQTGGKQEIIPAGQPGISAYKTLVCRVSLESNSYDDFLGNSPVSVKNFKVMSSYKYELQRSIFINVQKSQYGGCDSTTDTTGIIQNDCTWLPNPDKNNLPSTQVQESYKSYQRTVKNFAQNNKPSGMDLTKTEAMLASLMTVASNMGQADENNNGIPDYIAGFGINTPTQFIDNPTMNIEWTAKSLKTMQISDQNFREKMIQYVNQNGVQTMDVDRIMSSYEQWKNALCKGPVTDTTGTQTAPGEAPFATLFKKNDIIGVDKDNNLIWDNNDEYYYITEIYQGPSNQWVYGLKAKHNSLLDQMKIDTFDYYRNLETGSVKVGVQRPGTDPGTWTGFNFNPNMELKNGVII